MSWSRKVSWDEEVTRGARILPITGCKQLEHVQSFTRVLSVLRIAGQPPVCVRGILSLSEHLRPDSQANGSTDRAVYPAASSV